MAQAGTVLGGRYVLAERIGGGGYGEVWRAADTVLARSVAVKLLHPWHTAHGEAAARFRAEARLTAALSHDNIARVYDFGEAAGGQPAYLVMELVDGPSLEAVLAAGPLDATRAMGIIAQVAAGLQAAHAAGMVHRDVKPGNLLLAPGDTVKITDFGLACTAGSASVTASGELVGTPGYLAPERTTGGRAGPASDLYSLGVVAYECLTGARPFTGMPLEVAVAHRDRPLPPLPASVPPDVAAFVQWLTAKDPAGRPGDAAEVAVRAALLRDDAGTGSATLRRRRGTWPPAGARRRALVAYACAPVAVTAIVVASVVGLASSPRPVTASSAPATAASAPVPVPSSAPASHRHGVVPAATGRAARPGRSPGTGPAAHPRPAAATANPGQGKGNGNGKAKGRGNGKGKGNGNGHGG